MTVRFYASTDSGAPSLVGHLTSGASILCDVLYACLVTGYGSKDPAGWTRPYLDPSPPNNGKGYVFRNSTDGSGSYFILIETHASIPTGVLYCAESVSGWGSWSTFFARGGTNAASVIFVPRSSTYNGSSRAWYVVADERFCIVAIQTGHFTGSNAWFIYCFGDFQSFIPGDDTNNAMAAGCWDQDSASYSNAENYHYLFSNIGAIEQQTIAARGKGVRRYLGGSAIANGGLFVGLMSPNPGQSNGLHSPVGHEFNNMPDTNPSNSLKWANRMYVWNPESPYIVRGRIPGIWTLAHAGAAGFATGDTCQGTGAIAGKEFFALNGIAIAGSKVDGTILLETSDTWYS